MSDNDMVNMARLAQRDDRMATGKLYGDLADRIEQLEREQSRLHTQCDGLMQAAMNNGQALILAEAKLAKAMAGLRKIADHKHFSWDQGWTQNAEARIASATLAELEGEPLGAEFEAVWDANKAELYQP